MHWLNYHHLRHFWIVAREGGLVPASRVLRVSHSTLSTQVHALEDTLGDPLFTKAGRRLVLTETGQVVYRYAEEIFGLGHEMVDAVRGRSSGQPLRLNVGAVDVVPKLVVRRLLEPALRLAEPVRLSCYEGAHDRLLADLALHTLHVVLSDAPVPAGSPIRAFHHLLGESGVSFFGTPSLARKYRRRFPDSLTDAPCLLPLETQPVRRALNQWFDDRGVSPRVVAEFQDSALFKVFGADGVGIFPAPTVVEADVVRQYGVRVIGRADNVRERFYAISLNRRLTHPAVVAISDVARQDLFGRRSNESVEP